MLIRLMVFAELGGVGAAAFTGFFFPEMAADSGPRVAIAVGLFCGLAVVFFGSKSRP